MSVNFLYGVYEGSVAGKLTINEDSVWLEMLEDDELLSATCELFEKAMEISLPLQDQFPGESSRQAARLKITKVTANRLRIRLLEFQANDGKGLPDAIGTIRYEQHCGLVSFGRAIYQGMAAYRFEVQKSGRGLFSGGSYLNKLGTILDRFNGT